MRKRTGTDISSKEHRAGSGDVLVSIEKTAAAVIKAVKRIRAAETHGEDAAGAYVAAGELREHMRALTALAIDVADREALYAERADKQFLELESSIRAACGKLGWLVDGQWPALYVDRALLVEVSEQKRTISVAGKKLRSTTTEEVLSALQPLVRDLLPANFSPERFMEALATAYDSVRGTVSQVPVFDLYRQLVVHSQDMRFWRDARTDTFTTFSIDQFRARLTRTLERGMTSSPDAREIRLLPPLNSRDGLFMYQPAESRFGFVGRVEFVPLSRSGIL